MKASEVIKRLQRLISDHRTDFDVAIDDGIELCQIEEIDLGAEEDNCIVVWIEI